MRSPGRSDVSKSVVRQSPPLAAVQPRPHSHSFPAPIPVSTTPRRNRQWSHEITSIYLDVGAQQFDLSWDEWCDYVRRRLKRPAVTVRGLTPTALRYRRLRLSSITTGDGTKITPPSEWWYDAVPPYVLVKSTRGKQSINWRRELEEILRRTLRAPYLAEERARTVARSAKYTVGLHEPGYLYLLRRKKRKVVKIGFALNVARRHRKLEGQYRDHLVLLATAPGTRADEAALHQQLAQYRLPYHPSRGFEWFTDTPAVRRCFGRCYGAQWHVETPPYQKTAHSEKQPKRKVR